MQRSVANKKKNTLGRDPVKAQGGVRVPVQIKKRPTCSRGCCGTKTKHFTQKKKAKGGAGLSPVLGGEQINRYLKLTKSAKKRGKSATTKDAQLEESHRRNQSTCTEKKKLKKERPTCLKGRSRLDGHKGGAKATSKRRTRK